MTKLTQSPEIYKTFTQDMLPSIQEKMSQYLDIAGLDTNRNALKDALAYSSMAPSKLFRPMLVLASHKLFSNNPAPIYPVAIAIEFIHTYSLIHDDLPAMDDDDLRRGQASCHVKFDEATAILAGDTLQAYAFEILSKDLTPHYPANAVLNAIHTLSHSLGLHGMVGGQQMDMLGHNAPNDIEKRKAYLSQMHQLKTGALIQSCVSIPARLENAPKDTINTLNTYAKHLGLLFQIVDDILDVTSTEETLGKSIGKDEKDNKLTYIQLYGLEGAKDLAKKEADLARNALNTLPDLDTEKLDAVVSYLETRSN